MSDNRGRTSPARLNSVVSGSAHLPTAVVETSVLGREETDGGGRENTRGKPELSTQRSKVAERRGKRGCATAVCTNTACVLPWTLTCSTQTPDPSSGAQMIMVLSMEAESRLRGCCSSPPTGGDSETN